MNDLSDDDFEALLERATDRYFADSALIGTPQYCFSLIESLKAIGVDEVACLIDFGMPPDVVLHHLKDLDRLRELSQSAPKRTEFTLPESISALVDAHGVTHFQCTPTLARVLVESDAGRGALGQLHCLLVGGEALTEDLAAELRRWVGGPVLNMYGPTETTVWSTYDVLGEGQVTIGRPLANTRAYIIDRWGHVQPIGVPGELVIGGAGVARGYANIASGSVQRFVRDDVGGSGRCYRTGDLARWRDDGRIEFLGRNDNQVKVRGFRVELGEVEVALAASGEFLESAVVALPNERGVAAIVAFVVPRNAGADGAQNWRARLGQWLPDYAIPSQFVTLQSLPRSVSGKIDRTRLAVAVPEPVDETYAAPRDATEATLADLWSTLLRLPKVGIHDNFFAIGGDSIISIQMVGAARRRGIVLTPRLLFQHQTIAGLAPYVKEVRTVRVGADLVGDEIPLSPIQSWFFDDMLANPEHYNQALLLGMREATDLSSVTAALEAVVRHHPAFRYRFQRTEQGWRQSVGDDRHLVLVDQANFSSLDPGEHDDRLLELADTLHGTLKLDTGPLVRALWVGDHYDGNLLLLVIHHLVVDGLSWRILIEDLETALEQLATGANVNLAPVTASFGSWSKHISAFAGSPAGLHDAQLWQRDLANADARLPLDHTDATDADNLEETAQTVSVELEAGLTEILLKQVPRAYNTMINDALLTALVIAVSEWSGQSSLLVDLEGHGREMALGEIDLSRTVGWLTTLFPVLIERPATGGIDATLRGVKETLRRLPSNGATYGMLRYLHGDPSVHAAFGSLPQARMIFNYLGQADATIIPHLFLEILSNRLGRQHGPAQLRRHWLNVNAIVSDGALKVDFTFSLALHRPRTIEALAARYIQVLKQLCDYCVAAKGGFTPSDFPLLNMDQSALDELLSELPTLDSE